MYFTNRSNAFTALATLALSVCGGNAAASQPAQALPGGSVVAAAVTPFGVTAAGGYLTVSSGAGLVFKVNQTGGDITSITFNGGAELQSSAKGSHIASGLGATVSYTVSGTVAKITLTTATLTHYFLVRQNENNIYMGTYITAEPGVGELRWITRLSSAITGWPAHSHVAGASGTLDSGDVYQLPDGTTRSKFYGNQRAKDLTLRGATGTGVGIFMAYGSRESSSGGPFYRDIQFQSGTGGEIYNYMNSGHAQTEANRMGFHGPYALMFTSGPAPSTVPDMSWMGNHGLNGWVPATGRGRVIGNGLNGRVSGTPYTVAFANANAQYWVNASDSNGQFASYGMKPGTYTMTVFKNELAVYTEQVTVTAGAPTTLNTRTITADPASASALWRVGIWDGTPSEFKNGNNFPLMHPADVRNGTWAPTTFAIGAAVNTFPSAQFGAVNSPTKITFNLTAAQIANRTVRVGITTAYANARPGIVVNAWSSATPAISAQPTGRSITIGTWRGNNTMFSFAVPASAFVVGTNTLTIHAVSGSAGSGGFLSPAFIYDAVDLL